MDKPSLTNRPDRPVTPKKALSSIEVTVDMNTDKVQQKLRAIAKHAGALADELDRIDNAWSCSNCGHGTKVTYYQDNTIECSQCESCGKLFGDELPTRLEGSQ